MKPVFIPHSSYQSSVMQQLQQHYSGGILVLVGRDWPLILKLFITDLSHTTTLLHNSYDDKGPEPCDPASMLRSYLLFLMTYLEIGITKWVDPMHRIPLYAIISGFEPGDIPSVGTFYDFLSRFWMADFPHLKPKKKPKKSKKREPKKRKKGEKAPTTSPRKVKRLVTRILGQGMKRSVQPFDLLLEFFQSQILAVSAKLDLLGNLDALHVAGDGRPVVTATYYRSKPTCECYAQGLAKCNHPRVYSQPDCDSGWDSSREKYDLIRH